MWNVGGESILVATGVLFGVVVALGFMPRVMLDRRARGAYGLLSAGLLAAALALTADYGIAIPPAMWCLPLIPLAVLLGLWRDGFPGSGHTAMPAQSAAAAHMAGHVVGADADVPDTGAAAFESSQGEQPVTSPCSGRNQPSVTVHTELQNGIDARCRAANPETPANELAHIAYRHPEARAAVAGNPATPSNVLEWLAAIGDQSILDTIAARSN
ncbi:hypothetical protein [Demequina sediminicola]|uniref:variant leucine-rich repeat-containing protein n=1 Tax=Demequina sediminicola TaxID=1095026 RepID=UPI000782C443|nr:hypothetical protein [Demequina sediminicola]